MSIADRLNQLLKVGIPVHMRPILEVSKQGEVLAIFYEGERQVGEERVTHTQIFAPQNQGSSYRTNTLENDIISHSPNIYDTLIRAMQIQHPDWRAALAQRADVLRISDEDIRAEFHLLVDFKRDNAYGFFLPDRKYITGDFEKFP